MATKAQFDALAASINADLDVLTGPRPLPQTIYDQVADPTITTVTVPTGKYYLPSYFNIQRSNLDLDFNNSTLYLYPGETGASNYYPFFFTSTVNSFVDPLSPTRNASHLTGTITTGTTQLTMDANEIMDVQPGEVVQIVAGVNYSDPVEPYKYIMRTVQSVTGQVITFTEPMGVDVTVYADNAALQAVCPDDQEVKIGPWGEDHNGGNYKKGLGTHHGLLRYVGGLSHDVTIRNLKLEIDLPPDNLIDQGKQIFFYRDVLRPSFYNIHLNNIIGVGFHIWRCDDVVLDGITVRGEGRAGIYQNVTMAGIFAALWGGTGIVYRNCDIQGRNIVLMNSEVSPDSVTFQNLNYNVDFEATWSLQNPAVVLGFYGQTLGSGARIEDSTLLFSGAAGVDQTMDPGNVVIFKDVTFGAFFPDYFAFDRHVIEGTLTVNGIPYGPLVVDTETTVRTSSGNAIIPPRGFYKSIRFRVTDPGSAVAIWDQWGNDYTAAALNTGNWTNLAVNHWVICAPGASGLANYFANSKLFFNWAGGGGGASATIEWEVSYYPPPGGAGWMMN